MTHGQRLAALLLVVMLVPCRADAADLDNLLNFFTQFCWRETSYLPARNVGFAPIATTPEDERRPGFGKYRLRAHAYPGSRFSRERDGVLTFVSRVDPPQGEALPKYLWHLVSVPRLDKPWDGLLVNHELPLKASVLPPTDYEFLDRASSVSLDLAGRAPGRYLVYNWASPAERRFVLERWIALFKSPFIEMALDTNRSYDHQFYYVPMPSHAGEISPRSWLHPSRRKVWSTGTAFGFVLDDQGNCVGKDRVEITP